VAKDQPAAEIELSPCPWCKAIPSCLGHYYDVIHKPGCFLGDNARTIIIQSEVAAWNTRSNITRAVDDEAKAQNCPDRIWLHELIEDGFVEREWAKSPSPAPYHRSVRYYRGDIAGGMIEVARTELIRLIEAKRDAYSYILEPDIRVLKMSAVNEMLTLLRKES